ncbi:hypothetical protein DSCA_01660 [Desulfosarcina alkanivorans]|uniref:HTH luxR-type domain-containing protein n=1 Tax=Desulfosarcina alkanivorans TaxID=571177 RepID=A0A5K7YBF4_9BACT|nr:PAS and helix-turn-helix domain-containing protein [Desulfosarcina alkanivorans]BBO66236.1 hypothetical protein DSCA_01660 [Desulfosarcina alkanivorans]
MDHSASLPDDHEPEPGRVTIFEMDARGRFIRVNPRGLERFGYSRQDVEAGAGTIDMVVPEDHQRVLESIAGTLAGQPVCHNEVTCLRKDGSTFPALFCAAARFRGRRPAAVLGILIENTRQKALETDIVRLRMVEMELGRAKRSLEGRVRARTRELRETRKAMRALVREKSRTERALRRLETELASKSGKLEDLNTALRFLLKVKDREKTGTEEKMMADLRDRVFPYLRKLERKAREPEIRALATVVDNHLKAIISPFCRRLGCPSINLTPAELNVALMVRAGKSTRQIADSLNVAYKTVETHRVRIRKKLGLTHRRRNLRTCLMTLGTTDPRHKAMGDIFTGPFPAESLRGRDRRRPGIPGGSITHPPNPTGEQNMP